MRKRRPNGEVTLTAGMLLALLPACGRNEMGSKPDASPDRPADLPAVPDTVAPVEDLRAAPDLPPTPDLPPDLRPGDLASDPVRANDPLPPTDPVRFDRPTDPVRLPDLSDGPSDSLPDYKVDDVRPDRPPDLPADQLPAPDVQNLDKPPAYDQTLVTDEIVKRDTVGPRDDRGIGDYCLLTGGTIDTQSCCSSVSDFRDMCVTGTGACGCSPSNSITVQVCLCPAPACFLPPYGCVGPGSTCTVGMDQTCNDSPIISSIRGRCVDNGRCMCTTGMSPTSGKCL